jgi:oligoribonuclease
MLMKYLSLDIETTGLDPQTCDIIEIGAVVDDLNLPEEESRPIFHVYVLPNEKVYHGDPFALSMHPVIFQRIAKREQPFVYLHPTEVAHAFEQFIDEHFRGADGNIRVTVAGKNVGSFDLPFLRRLPYWQEVIGSKIRHRYFDPGSMYYSPTIDTELPNTEKCLVRANEYRRRSGMPVLNTVVAHTAVDDAVAVCGIIRARLEFPSQP